MRPDIFPSLGYLHMRPWPLPHHMPHSLSLSLLWDLNIRLHSPSTSFTMKVATTVDHKFLAWQLQYLVTPESWIYAFDTDCKNLGMIIMTCLERERSWAFRCEQKKQINIFMKENYFRRSILTLCFSVCLCTFEQYLSKQFTEWDFFGRTIAQEVSCWLFTAAARVRSLLWSSGICDGQSGVGAGFLRVLSSITYHLGLV